MEWPIKLESRWRKQLVVQELEPSLALVAQLDRAQLS